MANVAAEKYFLAITNTTRDMIHLNDFAGRIIYANHATRQSLAIRLTRWWGVPPLRSFTPTTKR